MNYNSNLQILVPTIAFETMTQMHETLNFEMDCFKQFQHLDTNHKAQFAPSWNEVLITLITKLKP